jgi:hypothetical protein
MSKPKNFITDITNLQPSESPASTELSASTDVPPELQILGFWPTFVYYFVSTTFIGAIASAQTLQLDISSGLPFQLGILLGVLAGFAGAYFNRTTQLDIAIPDTETFNPKLAETLKNFGYAPVESSGTATIPGYELYRRNQLRHWFSGNLLVKRQPEQVKLYARARINRQLKQLLG